MILFEDLDTASFLLASSNATVTSSTSMVYYFVLQKSEKATIVRLNFIFSVLGKTKGKDIFVVNQL